jgi:hypothetical protein
MILFGCVELTVPNKIGPVLFASPRRSEPNKSPAKLIETRLAVVPAVVEGSTAGPEPRLTHLHVAGESGVGVRYPDRARHAVRTVVAVAVRVLGVGQVLLVAAMPV